MILQVVKSILFLSALTLPFWIAIRFAINVYGRRRHRHTSLKRELLLTSFSLYLVFLAAVTIVPLPVSRERRPGSEGVNLTPVLRTVDCLTGKQTGAPEGVRFCLENVLGNVALFMPLGIMLPLVSNKVRSLRGVLVSALSVSLGIEVAQLLSRQFGSYRSVDVDDVIFNVLGACLGYACFA